jgi:N-acetylmuramoyl-L-alanine amidase
MKYRPANIDGMPDVETAALLEALTNPAGPLPPVPAPPPVIGVPGMPPVEQVPVPVSAPAGTDPTAVPATAPVKDQH